MNTLRTRLDRLERHARQLMPRPGQPIATMTDLQLWRLLTTNEPMPTDDAEFDAAIKRLAPGVDLVRP